MALRITIGRSLTGKLQRVGGFVKNITIHFVVVALVAACSLGALFVPVAFSQSATMTAEIPFGFYAAGKLMPAGKYQVKRVSVGSSVMQISDGKGNFTFVQTLPAKNKQPSVGRLVFSRYGLVSVLSELDWAGYDTGHALIKTDYERELIAGNPQARVVLAAK
jgi:hypothetical protein